MTVAMILMGFLAGVVVGVWVCWGWMRNREWEREWARACHPTFEDDAAVGGQPEGG